MSPGTASAATYPAAGSPAPRARGRLRGDLSAALAEARLRLVNLSRYPGMLAMEVLTPILLTALPILLGQATGGASAAANFERNTGTGEYVAYLLIGSIVYVAVSRAFWDIAYWLRFEQETGTLEAIYLTPTGSLTLASGVALFSALRSAVTGVAAYLAGCLIFQVPILDPKLPLALLFIAAGLVPVYALAFLFGALVLKVREANALVNLSRWAVSFLMGIYFPVAVLPELLRALAMAFPATWMVHGVRSSLLGLGYFFEVWYLDLAVLWGFTLVTPIIAAWLFRRVEDGVRRNQGLGAF